MKYFGFVRPSVPGTKHATVEIVSVENGVTIPDGTVLLENSRAKEFIGCLIAFDKIMHKGSGSAYVVCSKIHKVEQPKQMVCEVAEEKQPEPAEKPVSNPVLEKKPEPEPIISMPKVDLPIEPDVDKLQQQIVSLKNNLSKKEATIDKLKKKIETLERKQSELKEMDKLNLGGETDFFLGEKMDFVLFILAEEFKKLKVGTRRYDVLKGILESNGYERILEKKRKAVKKILNCYDGLSGTMRKDLEKLGLFITETGSHYKIRYFGDSRYHITMSKTPGKESDDKVINDIKNMMM